jgi:hypothetical protein
LPVKRLVGVTAVLAVAIPIVAHGQSAPLKLTSMAGVDGNCSSLIVESRRTSCGGIALNMIYGERNASIMFKSGDGVVSFFGTRDDDGGLTVTKVTIAREAQPTQAMSQPATGRCSVAVLSKPNTHLECSADTSDGKHFAVAFTSTGAPR